MVEVHPIVPLLIVTVIVYVISITCLYKRTWGECRKTKNKYKDKK